MAGLLSVQLVSRIVRKHRLKDGIVVVHQVDTRTGWLDKIQMPILISALVMMIVAALFPIPEATQDIQPREDFSSHLRYGIMTVFALLGVFSLVWFAKSGLPQSLASGFIKFVAAGVLFAFPEIRIDLFMAALSIAGVAIGLTRHWQWRRWVRSQQAAKALAGDSEAKA
jgi:hypothetical protein